MKTKEKALKLLKELNKNNEYFNLCLCTDRNIEDDGNYFQKGWVYILDRKYMVDKFFSYDFKNFSKVTQEWGDEINLYISSDYITIYLK